MKRLNHNRSLINQILAKGFVVQVAHLEQLVAFFCLSDTLVLFPRVETSEPVPKTEERRNKRKRSPLKWEGDPHDSRKGATRAGGGGH